MVVQTGIVEWCTSVTASTTVHIGLKYKEERGREGKGREGERERGREGKGREGERERGREGEGRK